MKAFYDTIILSPHLDDAVLSCGGQICLKTACGQSVLIVTLMAGDPPESGLSPFAQSLHERWQLKNQVVAYRRNEDNAAAKLLGADTLHWTFPDCIYRRDPSTAEPYYTSNQAIFGEVDSSETFLITELAACLTTLPKAKQVYSPLGVGNHVDHQITRAAAEQSYGTNLVFYEEYPYSVVPGAVELLTVEKKVWQAQVVQIPEEALSTKIKAISAYVSQLSSFFNDRADLEYQVRHYHKTVGGERIWHQTPFFKPAP